MSSRIPSEIVDYIVDYLHDDRLTLLACSLTASPFLATSRLHLFSEVKLDYAGIDTFLQVLDVPYSTIAPAMRRLVIDKQKAQNTPAISSSKKREPYIPKYRANLVASLQGVQSICLSNCWLVYIPTPFWHLLSDLKGVHTLELRKFLSSSTTQFLSYVCALPSLKTMSVSEVVWDPLRCDLESFQSQKSLAIPLLEVTKHSQYGILEWLMTQQPVPHVNTLRIVIDTVHGPVVLSTVQRYLSAVGASVQHLILDVQSGIPDLQVSSGVDFSTFTNVKSISIQNVSVSTQNLQSHRLENFLGSVFSQAKSEYLHQVNLSMSVEDTNDGFSFFGIPHDVVLQCYNWGGLPGILEQNLGTQLEKLNVSINNYASYQHQTAESILRKGPFKGFDERGALHIDFPRFMLEEAL
ncbi:hypothetical protein BDQ12DRAFT_720273 [Crucibulum laeve]|uniref:F-box domain-containing protein n=1 Tax=Crucibulum laeve TaxID=68775 RepID=A0A5C3MJQ8_9AGAR|nr:hypothetical protein BDQ12DRAFT_720273 [Crucibulum laeve]